MGDVSRWFNYLLLIVVILALATAVRFYFVSWLGERVVADMRLAAHENLLRQEPAFFEMNRPSEIASRMTSDTAIIEQIVGSTVSIALRNTDDRHWRRDLYVRTGAEACRISSARHSGGARARDRRWPAPAPARAHQPGSPRRRRHHHRRSAGRDEDRPGVRAGSRARRRASARPSTRISGPHASASPSAPS